MPSTLELIQAAVLGTLLIYAYAGYSALSIRKIMGVGSPRRQALGVALMASAFALLSAASIILYSFFTVNGNITTIYQLVPAQTFLFTASVTLFYWVDSSIIVARRSDPHSRDTIRWSSLRKFLWGTIWVAIGIAIANLGYLFASGTYVLSGGPPATPELVLLLLIVFWPFSLGAILGTVVLPVVARRSKDATLRKHIYWFFGFAASQTTFYLIPLIILTGTSVSPIPIWGLANLVGGFCLYRSAKSLVPLHRFPTEDEGTS